MSQKQDIGHPAHFMEVRVRYLLALTMLFCGFSVAHAATTGNELVAACKVYENFENIPHATVRQFADAGQCQATMETVMDTMMYWRMANEDTHGKASGYACIPEGVTLGQAASVFLKYAREHPNLLHIGATTLVIGALRDGFPCRP